MVVLPSIFHLSLNAVCLFSLDPGVPGEEEPLSDQPLMASLNCPNVIRINRLTKYPIVTFLPET